MPPLTGDVKNELRPLVFVEVDHVPYGAVGKGRAKDRDAVLGTRARNGEVKATAYWNRRRTNRTGARALTSSTRETISGMRYLPGEWGRQPTINPQGVEPFVEFSTLFVSGTYEHMTSQGEAESNTEERVATSDSFSGRRY